MINFKKIKKNDMVKIIAGKDVGKSGKILEVDLTEQRFSEREFTENEAKKYLLGSGLSAKILY